MLTPPSRLSRLPHRLSRLTRDQFGQFIRETPKSTQCSDVGAGLYDWRTPLLTYLRDPSTKIEKSVRHSAFKYVLHNDELYRRTTEDLLLKCLDSNQARVAMGEVHEGICGTHQSTPKMKWLLRRANFYWPTMMADCFHYYKGCEKVSKV
jgi:hypothetical protein